MIARARVDPTLGRDTSSSNDAVFTLISPSTRGGRESLNQKLQRRRLLKTKGFCTEFPEKFD